jgi:hypothetical protein
MMVSQQCVLMDAVFSTQRPSSPIDPAEVPRENVLVCVRAGMCAWELRAAAAGFKPHGARRLTWCVAYA